MGGWIELPGGFLPSDTCSITTERHIMTMTRNKRPENSSRSRARWKHWYEEQWKGDQAIISLFYTISSKQTRLPSKDRIALVNSICVVTQNARAFHSIHRLLECAIAHAQRPACALADDGHCYTETATERPQCRRIAPSR